MPRALRLRAREILVASLSRAMNETEATQRSVARLAQVAPVTVHRWLQGETPISVEAVLSCQGLGEAFRRALCTFDHSPTSAPYIAKAPKRRPGAR